MLRLLSIVLLIGSLGCNSMELTQVINSQQMRGNFSSQAQVKQLAQSLQVNYQHIANQSSKQCDVNQADGYCFEAKLTLTATQVILPKADWAIYFSHITPIQQSLDPRFIIEHLNGDLHKITPTQAFKGLSVGQSTSFAFLANYWMLNEYDALPNYIFKAKGFAPEQVRSTQVVFNQHTQLPELPFVQPFNDAKHQQHRTVDDKFRWQTAEQRYLTYQKRVASNNQAPYQIIPTPKLQQKGEKQLTHVKQLKLSFIGFDQTQLQAGFDYLAKLGLTISNKAHATLLTIKKDLSLSSAESYQLRVDQQGIIISASTEQGAFYGLMSLASLYDAKDQRLAFTQVTDQPSYPFRGFMLDVARNFHHQAFVFNLIDQMAALKLNKLHLHLADDEGWRVEIPALPELTELGSKRCFDLTEQQCLLPQLGAGIEPKAEVNGYFTVKQYQQILRYAKAHFIEVIPSFDMPGHSRAAVKAMQLRAQKLVAQGKASEADEYRLDDPLDQTQYRSVQYYHDNTMNVCLDSSYRFVEKVISELQAIHLQVGVPLKRYHIGADETAGAWVKSPACQAFMAKHQLTKPEQLSAYFVEQVANMLAKKGLIPAVWSDGMLHTKAEHMPKHVQVNAWSVLAWQGHQATHQLLNRHWQVVLSFPDVLYFDFPYAVDPQEPGYYWGARFIDTEKVFQFMPEHLPAHAQIWPDREGNAYTADDRQSVLKPNVTIHGIQGQLWSENTRTDALAQYKLFPRLFALAERAWHKPSWQPEYNYQRQIYNRDSKTITEKQLIARDQAWQQFAQGIGNKQLIKLDKTNTLYRIGKVGLLQQSGHLYANSAWPGLAIAYQIDQGNWQSYQAPLDVSLLAGKTLTFVAYSADGSRQSKAVNYQINLN